MKRKKTVIVLIKRDNIEVWDMLTTMCRSHEEFCYHYLKKMKFPFFYKGWEFIKVPYGTKDMQ